VNILPVYPGFEVFRDLILEVLENYRSVADPGNPAAVSLRYINHIRSLPGDSDIGSCLKLAISYPQELSHPPQQAAARLVLPYGELGSLGLATAFPSRIGQSDIGALLDLEFSWEEPKDFDLDRFPVWLDEAHQIIYAAFTASVLEPVLSQMRGERP
jgi:uncharacterized protein (TIGR04255 family)